MHLFLFFFDILNLKAYLFVLLFCPNSALLLDCVLTQNWKTHVFVQIKSKHFFVVIQSQCPQKHKLPRANRQQACNRVWHVDIHVRSLF